MNKRVFIIHGWDGYPEEGWFPWLKRELETKGFVVKVPAMPNSEAPQIREWVNTLKKVGGVDENTFFVGHSIGCQTIIRYFEGLDVNVKVGGAVFVAGWTHLTPAAIPDEESAKVAKPWLETNIDWEKVKSHTDNFVVIFSDDDPMVPISEKDIFEEKLGAKIIIEPNKGHFSGDDRVNDLQIVVDELNKMIKR